MIELWLDKVSVFPAFFFPSYGIHSSQLRKELNTLLKFNIYYNYLVLEES